MEKLLDFVINGDYASFKEAVLPTMTLMAKDKIRQKEEFYSEQLKNRDSLMEARSEYKTFLAKKCKEHDITSPFQLEKSEQLKFWAEVKKEWAEESKEDLKESEDLSPKQEEYRNFFMKKLKKFNVGSPAELSSEEKSKFFKEIESDWNGGR